jgi:hypothetical protein
MSFTLGVILVASSIALAAGVAYRDLARRQPRRYLPTALLALLGGGVYVLAFPDGIESKGSIAETAAVAICYLSMVTGMAAEYFFTQAERGERKLTFDAMAFLMPIFASPIVFIPLLTITSEVAMGGGAFTKSKLMVYLVAFQNGFFWKGFFEQRRHLVQKTGGWADVAGA